MNVHVGSIKASLATRSDKIVHEHRSGASGFATCMAFAAAMDDVLQSAFSTLDTNARSEVAVFALGGYGRAELCPKSDIDIMVLCASGSDEANNTARQFLHILWDAGLDIGHSVRTVQEALAMHGKTLDAWTSMLESRYVCGSTALAEGFLDELRNKASAGEQDWLVKGILAAVQKRHDRYGHSVKLLEPNIKNSAGAFRDFHAILWLFRGTDAQYLTPAAATMTASERFLGQLLATGEIEAETHSQVMSALQFLFRTRHEMHARRGSLYDTLEYALQREVAESLLPPQEAENRVNDAERQPVETFMREYYLHARTIHRFHERLVHRFREVLEPMHKESPEPLDAVFMLQGDSLSVQPTVQRFDDARRIFEAFTHAAENEADLDFRLRAVVERSVDLLTDEHRRSKEIALLFKRILYSRRVAQTLRTMNDLGVLGRYIPEFEKLVAFFQHNVYHYFTADEHTLIAIANAERLREEQGVLHEVFRTLPRKDILYLAILLHDIAKPRGVADHEITGVEMARTILKRIGMDDAIDDVAFLVRHHLLMEQIAFRRNIHDPETIRDFAGKFDSRERLDYLYLLTYADLSAVNVNVWTDWKSAMLQDLYQLTAEVLRRNLRGPQIDSYHRSRREAAAVDIMERLSMTIPRDHIERHLRGIHNDSYIALFTDKEISGHITHSETDKPVSTLFSHSEGYTEVTVIARDAPFALSKFCAVLTANDANIFDANVFTRDDGIIIDRFRVTATSGKTRLDQKACNKITEDLGQVVEGTLDLDRLFEAHRHKWKRARKPSANPNIRTDVDFEDTPDYTIIDVYAPDSVGFLYRVTETISRLGLDIYFAKIATRGDGIVDAFYVRDRNGKPVTDPSNRTLIRSEILKTIGSIMEQELS